MEKQQAGALRLKAISEFGDAYTAAQGMGQEKQFLQMYPDAAAYARKRLGIEIPGVTMEANRNPAKLILPGAK